MEKSLNHSLEPSVPLVIEVVSTDWRDGHGKRLVDFESLGIAEYVEHYLGLGRRRYIGSPKPPLFDLSTG